MTFEAEDIAAIERDLIQTAAADKRVIISSLPALLNREFKPSRWFNRFSGDLEGSTTAESTGTGVNIISNPIGAAFDVARGSWDSVAGYVRTRAAGGYMRDYMRARRSGALKSGLIKGKKRVPFMLKAVYKIDKFIRQILENESRKDAA